MPAFSQSSPLTIELFDRNRHDRSSFDCGVPALNAYLQRLTSQDMEKRAAVVYVGVIDAPSIAGYYTLSQFSIELTRLPESLAKRLARYPEVSTTLLGRLAVSHALQGQGLGETLLFDALRRSLAQSAHIASAGVVVDAQDEKAASFNGEYGFTPIQSSKNRLFLHMKDIQQLF
jgi:GNAT superfamily N-acetyltransferase